MEEEALEKIQISGPTLASLLQRFTSDFTGVLLGHVTLLSPSHLSDDLSSAPAATAVATITNFLTLSLDETAILNLSPYGNVIGWFSGRRRTPSRPSLRESSFTAAISRKHSTCVFLLLTSPPPSPADDDRNPNGGGGGNLIHTHEYRAYHYLKRPSKFVAKTLDVVNIGPAFRRHYGSFSPTSPFPPMACDFRGLASMAEDHDQDHDGSNKRALEGMGVDVARLGRLMGPETANYTAGLEDMYKGMLARLGELARLVEESESKVLKQLLKQHEAPNSTSQKDIKRGIVDVDSSGKGEKNQKELITYQRRKKRDTASIGKPTSSIATPANQFSLIDSSSKVSPDDEVERKITDEKGENVPPFGLSRTGPNSTSPEEDPVLVKGNILDPEIKVAPHLCYEPRVNLNGSDLQDQLPRAGEVGMGDAELVDQQCLAKSTSGTELTSPLSCQVPSCQLNIEGNHSGDVYSPISLPWDTSSRLTNESLVTSSLNISLIHKDCSSREKEHVKCDAGDNFFQTPLI